MDWNAEYMACKYDYFSTVCKKVWNSFKLHSIALTFAYMLLCMSAVYLILHLCRDANTN